ncbi:MAG: ABC transporter substrate-binding protein [Anaerolineae bacterium]|nr:ABC transporter substrate-binding protein [Anaerolineae bacterium]MCA9889256.1 ABC transporter substrate-binding protein [Anaerolineae bacterium]MCB9460658.1 ABC transporter substrate-binding protein [Anaerolineaceae bacterium]
MNVKRSTSLLTLVMLLIIPLMSVQLSAQETRTLVVSTFGFNQDLIDKNVTEPFEEMYDVDVIYESGNNAERLTRLEAMGENTEVDVVHFAGAYAMRAKQLDLLQEIDVEALENYDELYEFAQDPLGDNMGIGYAINSHALAYRPDMIEEPITSWADLLREDVAGFVSIPEMSTTFGPANIIMMAAAMGGDPTDPEDWELGWEVMPELAGQLVTTYTRSADLVALYQQEEVWVSPYSSFARGNLMETGVELEFVIPEEGAVGDPIVVSIVKGTENEDLALAYIDFLISAEVQEAEALDLVDSPTNMTVEVPEDIAPLLTYGEDLIDSLIFMDQAALNELLDEWLERWNEIMLQ